MGESIFFELPPELRVQVYRKVFENTRITINSPGHQSTPGGRQGPGGGNIVFGKDAEVTMACKLIRQEALPVLWSEAVVTAKGVTVVRFPRSSILFVCDTGVAPEKLAGVAERFLPPAAGRITSLRGVRFPDPARCPAAPAAAPAAAGADAGRLLAWFPSLRTCGVDPFSGCAAMRPSAAGDGTPLSCGDFMRGETDLLRQLLPFAPRNMERRPSGGYLAEYFGITSGECRVQFITQVKNIIVPVRIGTDGDDDVSKPPR